MFAAPLPRSRPTGRKSRGARPHRRQVQSGIRTGFHATPWPESFHRLSPAVFSQWGPSTTFLNIFLLRLLHGLRLRLTVLGNLPATAPPSPAAREAFSRGAPQLCASSTPPEARPASATPTQGHGCTPQEGSEERDRGSVGLPERLGETRHPLIRQLGRTRPALVGPF